MGYTSYRAEHYRYCSDIQDHLSLIISYFASQSLYCFAHFRGLCRTTYLECNEVI